MLILCFALTILGCVSELYRVLPSNSKPALNEVMYVSLGRVFKADSMAHVDGSSGKCSF